MTGTATDWLAKAHDDLRTVELLDMFDEYPCVVAAFHYQQAVEKSLKAFLTWRNVAFLYRHEDVGQFYRQAQAVYEFVASRCST